MTKVARERCSRHPPVQVGSGVLCDGRRAAPPRLECWHRYHSLLGWQPACVLPPPHSHTSCHLHSAINTSTALSACRRQGGTPIRATSARCRWWFGCDGCGRAARAVRACTVGVRQPAAAACSNSSTRARRGTSHLGRRNTAVPPPPRLISARETHYAHPLRPRSLRRRRASTTLDAAARWMQLQPQKSTRKKRLVRSARRERECLRLSFETRRTKKPSRKVVYHLQYIIKDILCVQVQAAEWSKHTCIQTKSYRKLLALAIGFLDSSKSLWPIDARSEASDDRRAAHTQCASDPMLLPPVERISTFTSPLNQPLSFVV